MLPCGNQTLFLCHAWTQALVLFLPQKSPGNYQPERISPCASTGEVRGLPPASLGCWEKVGSTLLGALGASSETFPWGPITTPLCLMSWGNNRKTLRCPCGRRGPVPVRGLSGCAGLRGVGSPQRVRQMQGWGAWRVVQQRGGVFPGWGGRKLLFSSIWPDGRWDPCFHTSWWGDMG